MKKFLKSVTHWLLNAGSEGKITRHRLESAVAQPGHLHEPLA